MSHRLAALFMFGTLAGCAAELAPEQTAEETSAEVCSLCCPAAPSATTARAQGVSTLKVTWSDNSNNETGFIVERSDNGGPWFAISEPGANAESDIDGFYSGAVSFRYRVSAFNAICTSLPSPVAVVPKAPTNLVGTPIGGGKAALTWTDRSNNETGFVMQKRTATTPWGDFAQLGANTTGLTVTLTPGANRFRLRAVSSTGASWYSNEVNLSP